MSLQGIFPIDKWDFNSQSILADLPDEDVRMLSEYQTTQCYNRGDVIFMEGAYPSGVFSILGGMVKKYKLDGEGREQIIYVAGTGELIGYHAVLSEDRYPDSAAALQESTVAFIPKEDFLFAVNRSDLLSKRLLRTLSHEFTVLINNLTLFAKRSVRERLALQLIVLREKSKLDFKPGSQVEIDWSRDDLASLVGTARENVVRILSEFREAGILETRGRKILVLDVKKLIEISKYS